MQVCQFAREDTKLRGNPPPAPQSPDASRPARRPVHLSAEGRPVRRHPRSALMRLPPGHPRRATACGTHRQEADGPAAPAAEDLPPAPRRVAPVAAVNSCAARCPERCAPPGRTRRAGGAGSRQQKRSTPAPDDPPRRRRPKPGRACRGPGESPSFTPDAGPSARPRTGCPRSSRVVRPAGAGACRPCVAVRRSGARRPARGRRRCPCAW